MDGKFKLYPFKDGDSPVNPQDLECCECFKATVPGNIEQALMNEGVIPDFITVKTLKIRENMSFTIGGS